VPRELEWNGHFLDEFVNHLEEPSSEVYRPPQCPARCIALWSVGRQWKVVEFIENRAIPEKVEKGNDPIGHNSRRGISGTVGLRHATIVS